ncbi:MAG: TrkA family potassium uptake protein [Sphaerochaetaceae bacterium]|jgi:trk system potassium uptake protein TrkA|nr:TrkA family potassium uptake protein [Sphaerochaetaceae bacterium]
MKSILLIGLGRFGLNIAKKLKEMNQQVLAIDSSETRVNDAMKYVTDAQIGDSTNQEFLSTLGVSNFDVCIVAIGDDFQSSLETVYLLSELKAKKIIARASRLVQEKFLLRNGADEVVYPERQLANWTAIRCSSDSILDYIQLDEGHSIFEVTVPEEWYGKTVGKLDVRRKYEINIIGIRTKGKLNLSITADTVFEEGQTVLVLGASHAVQKCFRL